mmetsp:Transcript_20770/g.30744  ORF Transcript_20770/g.30744 Transcript_20770/m.30744 type:complete len:727 (-) Transcript_20770:1593-3773(-)
MARSPKLRVNSIDPQRSFENEVSPTYADDDNDENLRLQFAREKILEDAMGKIDQNLQESERKRSKSVGRNRSPEIEKAIHTQYVGSVASDSRLSICSSSAASEGSSVDLPLDEVDCFNGCPFPEVLTSEDLEESSDHDQCSDHQSSDHDSQETTTPTIIDEKMKKESLDRAPSTHVGSIMQDLEDLRFSLDIDGKPTLAPPGKKLKSKVPKKFFDPRRLAFLNNILTSEAEAEERQMRLDNVEIDNESCKGDKAQIQPLEADLTNIKKYMLTSEAKTSDRQLDTSVIDNDSRQGDKAKIQDLEEALNSIKKSMSDSVDRNGQTKKQGKTKQRLIILLVGSLLLISVIILVVVLIAGSSNDSNNGVSAINSAAQNSPFPSPPNNSFPGPMVSATDSPNLPIIPITSSPTNTPTSNPTETPTKAPIPDPTFSPTPSPTSIPTPNPTTITPTKNPTGFPSPSPTVSETEPIVPITQSPSSIPTIGLTETTMEAPSTAPTRFPTSSPIFSFTPYPAEIPTEIPTEILTDPPSSTPPTIGPSPEAPVFTLESLLTIAMLHLSNSPSVSPSSSPQSPSVSPSSSPSHSPSVSPSISPSNSPSVPPSSSPSNSPSYSPSACTSTISIRKTCYRPSQDIIVADFSNCDPQPGDWIGIYNTKSISLLDDTYYDWGFTCGDRLCEESPSDGIVGLSIGNLAFDTMYQVVLLRADTAPPPYEALARSADAFAISDLC